MYRRGWRRDIKCCFCDENETINYLFFACSAAKYMWSVVSLTIGAPDRPGNLTQYFRCITCYVRGLTLHVVGVAAL
jgi:hypothetical protein